MVAETLILIMASILGFGLISGRIQRTILTPPIMFVSLGIVYGLLNLIDLHIDEEIIRILAEITLVVVLFSDASRIQLSLLRQEYQIPLRLLSIGMPLTILLGAIMGVALFPDLGLWQACILATVLAPTDAALGQAVVSSPRVPVRIRQALNVESGLNDGIAVPVVLIFLSLASTTGETGDVNYWATFIGGQLILGPIVGIIIGYLGGQAIIWGERTGWMEGSFQRLAGIAIALLAFGVAEFIGGNGFIAAFVAGLTFGNTAKSICHYVYEFMEAEGQLLTLLTFLIFGSVMVLPELDHLNGMIILYGILSLTVIRMLPIALSLIGMKFQWDTLLFLGWFGPRGIASVIFGLLVLERHDVEGVEEIFIIVVVTVLMSVVAHGLTAVPAANAYGDKAESMADEDMPEMMPVPEMRVRLPYDDGQDTQAPAT